MKTEHELKCRIECIQHVLSSEIIVNEDRIRELVKELRVLTWVLKNEKTQKTA